MYARQDLQVKGEKMKKEENEKRMKRRKDAAQF